VAVTPGDPHAASLSLAAGVALIRAAEVAAPATGLMLKWPNDLLMGGAKLGGILLERNGDRLVAGFGLNLAKAPEIDGGATAALASIALVSPRSFAPILAGSFARALDLWRTDSQRLTTAWMESAHPIGTMLSVHASAGEQVEGKFDGLEPDGAMRLLLADGTSWTIHAGDVALA
jgi:BirA family biotin operon repressor/biotin-[acetyl-CoA-carboxylase] ligase